MTIPADAIQDTVRGLIETQIKTFAQPTRLTSSELGEYHRRSYKIQLLYKELDRIGTASFLKRLAKASLI